MAGELLVPTAIRIAKQLMNFVIAGAHKLGICVILASYLAFVVLQVLSKGHSQLSILKERPCNNGGLPGMKLR